MRAAHLTPRATGDHETRRRRLIPKPPALARFETRLARALPLHPNLISAAKLLLVTPAILLTLEQVDLIPGGLVLVVALFAAFAALDYLDGVVARGRDLESNFGRLFDRFTDYPLLFGVTLFCLDILPPALLLTKLGLDLLLFLLFWRGRGSTANRLRTTISYTTLLSLLIFSQGWLPGGAGDLLVQGLLVINILFSATVVLHNLGLLHRRRIADALSAGNLLCGLLSIRFAVIGSYALCLVCLLLGAAFDGLDGAAARRWGGSRVGVLADDVADAISYGIAPAVALAFGIGGVAGIAIGVAFAIFTITRLVHFTLTKGSADPRFFSGVPSTVGGLVALTALVLFGSQPALVGFLVGMVCAQMVAFDARFRHPGRLLTAHPELLFATPLLLWAFSAAYLVWGGDGPIGLIFALAAAYGLGPTLLAFARRARLISAGPSAHNSSCSSSLL